MLTEYFSVFLLLCVSLSFAARTREDCQKIADGLDPIVEAINVTDRFLRSPEEYKEYADKCEAIINCGTELDATKVPLLLQKISPCLFYMFYNREFSTCAHKLIAKKDDKIPCLNTLFNDIHEPEVDECVQWDGLQPCIKEQIGKECDAAMLKEYEKQEKNLRPELCD
ncbi:hypothetical protein CRE_05105 [Caenorhabditis remanei]|uniref:T20D4.11-like domain-containing protein n=1 Tax=Caenorhabditis remanei TaxID=31234 RepID=E3MZ74_CAERE|nr:hypothetical protein CRE_05105 [Caenorhabditis remanei]